jgi:predicted enzyme related to lactoylglutathione lyase
MESHPIVHIELSSSDPEKSAAFYSDIFGWKTRNVPEMTYATFDPGIAPGGGFAPVDQGFKAGSTMIYIDADDINGMLDTIASKGGKIIQRERDIPGVGWWGVFEDPWGNHVALFRGLPDQPNP